jgi:hypothetical protein
MQLLGADRRPIPVAQQHAAEELPEPGHLIMPSEVHQIARNRTIGPPDEGSHVAAQESATADQDRVPGHLVYGAKKLPQWVGAETVVLLPVLKPRHELARVGGPQFAMVYVEVFGKRACFPAVFAGRQDSNYIYPAAF